MQDISVFEAIDSQRAIRQFTDEPVPQEAIARILRAAIRAPSPSNRQGWHFLVIRDPDVKNSIGEIYWRATQEAQKESPPNLMEANTARVHKSADDLARRIGKVPVLIMACLEIRTAGPSSRGTITLGAAIYPAVQNLMLAARGLGLGTCLTTRHRRFEQETKKLLGIPETMDTAALIALGYPGGEDHFGGSRRVPLEQVTSYEHWGKSQEQAHQV